MVIPVTNYQNVFCIFLLHPQTVYCREGGTGGRKKKAAAEAPEPSKVVEMPEVEETDSIN